MDIVYCHFDRQAKQRADQQPFNQTSATLPSHLICPPFTAYQEPGRSSIQHAQISISTNLFSSSGGETPRYLHASRETVLQHPGLFHEWNSPQGGIKETPDQQLHQFQLLLGGALSGGWNTELSGN